MSISRVHQMPTVARERFAIAALLVGLWNPVMLALWFVVWVLTRTSRLRSPDTIGATMHAINRNLAYGMLLFGLAAVLLGIVALRRIARSRDARRGRGLAIAGIVLGAPLFLVYGSSALLSVLR